MRSNPKSKISLKAIVGLAIVLLLKASLAGAETGSANEAAIDAGRIHSTGQVIEANASATDSQIQARLEAILASSEQFNQLEVRVDNGLVFLRGFTDKRAFIEWAEGIASNTQGVVAVVNNLEQSPGSYFSASVFKAELVKAWYRFLHTLPLLLAAALTFVVFFFVSRPVSAFLVGPVRYVTDSALIKVVLQRIVAVLIVLLGLYFFLRIAGLTQFAVAVMSGTGLLGLVVGFAFRDIAENFIASLLISMQRPFRLGDVIEVSGFRGVVQKVTTRGTTLVDFDGNHIQVPNATIYKNVIQNFSANPNVRGNFLIGVGYDSRVRFAQETAMAVMLEHPAVLADPEPQVLIEELASSTINLRVYFWVNANQYSVVKVASALMRQVVRAFEAADVSMPDDAREVIFPQGVPWESNSEAGDLPAPKETTEPQPTTPPPEAAERLLDDLASDTGDIQKQAQNAREPEEGKNII
ncbi:mechanosensitive ion channel family protein [Gilvimarinus algae]|uniref:Small-conductance mechanosensitive channel n=1 Tax=Gilvimarinus algae TaxID=3058037 RepID=A0ABT8TBQ5_9GAMM|nr:mechanosensitive ion channel family protein [Gilvimarinus sp. SDUM040014]MDO3381529.1 mechanosensitive ion channel family protein [Gilvimarinus sp. SDUM040014]